MTGNETVEIMKKDLIKLVRAVGCIGDYFDEETCERIIALTPEIGWRPRVINLPKRSND